MFTNEILGVFFFGGICILCIYAADMLARIHDVDLDSVVKEKCYYAGTPLEARGPDVAVIPAALLVPGVTMREAVEADLPDIQSLLFEIFQEPQFNDKTQGHTLWERMQERYQADSQKNLKDFWGPDPVRRYAVVLHDSASQNLIGVAWILAKDGVSTVGELNKLYLQADYRGKGLGKRVLTLMLSQAKALGFTTLYLITGRELTSAIALYKGFGFIEVDQERYHNSPNSIAMELPLVA
ncbi:MAG: GNAT family N-acetyltransferase [Cyanobacteria bacterium REEB67]|nr:GNAT family N-acetyltransferase [Cyanobacteria bacterium REEB67]